jgi:L-fucose isomerase-like protein
MIRAKRLDFLMIQLTAFPSGEAIIRLAKSCNRIGVWGIPESSFEGSNFVNSNNSFCGMNMACSIAANYLGRLTIQYKWFFGHANDERFVRRFALTVNALTVIKKMASSRVALVGGIAPGFNDLYYDERLATARLGVEIQRGHEFSEIQKRAHAYDDREIELLAECYACSKCAADVKKQDLTISTRYYKAYNEFAAENGYDALAVSCWPQIKEDTLACSVIGKLNQAGIPASCEGDVPGVVSMLMLRYMTGNPATLMDMCGIDEQDETALMWHCGPSPEFYAGEGGATTTCSYQLNLAGETVSYALIHDMVFKPQPVTFMRVTGEWDQMFLLDGNVIENRKPSPDGSRGWIGNLRLNKKPIRALDLVNTIMTHGFQHHYPMMAGDVSAICMEIASWLGVKMLEEIPYEDYMQRM